MRRITVAMIAFLLFASCENTTYPVKNPDASSEGKVSVVLDLGAVGALARSQKITPSRLIIRLSPSNSTPVLDTVVLAGGGAVARTYALPSGGNWLLTVRGLDQRDSLIYYGSKAFDVQPRQTTTINLSLDALYSSFTTRFPVRDSMTRFVLSVDGRVWGDSSVQKQARVGDTIVFDRDYLPASASGTAHRFGLRVYGMAWGVDTLLYSLDTSIATYSGINQGLSFLLKWVGPVAPPTGTFTLAVTMGTVGQIQAVVSYELPLSPDFGIPWNTSVTYGTLVDVRDGRSYRTVLLGGRTWMAENLDYGGPSGAIGLCDSCVKYGRAYNWAEAMALPSAYNSSAWGGYPSNYQGVCPMGWHVPVFEELSSLMEPMAGGLNLKSRTGWDDSKVCCSSDNGFRAIPTEFRNGLGVFTVFLSATEAASTTAHDMELNYSAGYPHDYGLAKTSGGRLRCVKN